MLFTNKKLLATELKVDRRTINTMTEKEKWLFMWAMELAFMAGRWRGQVDLEEDMDNDYFDAFIWVLHDKKTAMPLHTVSCTWDERAVKYKLRNIWKYVNQNG